MSVFRRFRVLSECFRIAGGVGLISGVRFFIGQLQLEEIN